MASTPAMAMLLSARKQMGGMALEGAHTDDLQAVVDAAADLFRVVSLVFGGKGNILFNDGGDDPTDMCEQRHFLNTYWEDPHNHTMQ